MKEKIKNKLAEIEKMGKEQLTLKIHNKIDHAIDILLFVIIFPAIVLHELAHYCVYLVARVFKLPLKMTVYNFPKLEDMKSDQLEASLTMEIEIKEKLSIVHRFFVVLIALAPGFLMPIIAYLIYLNHNLFFTAYLVMCLYLMIPSAADRYLFKLAFASNLTWLELKTNEA